MTLTLPWGILAFILAVQSVANIGPMGLPAIAPLIRDDVHLSLTQAGSFLSAYEVVRVPVVSAAGYLAQAQATGILGRVGFGLLSDRLFGGRRLIVLFLAGAGSMICSVAIAATGPVTPPWFLSLLTLTFGFAGIGWNGVQHTLMAELAGPRAAGTAVGLGLAVSSLGVTLGPLVFGWTVERTGGYRAAWIGLAASMAAALTLLGRVREWRASPTGEQA